MLEVRYLRHGNFFSVLFTYYFVFLFDFFFKSLIWSGIVLVVFPQSRTFFSFFMRITMESYSKWHRLLQLASKGKIAVGSVTPLILQKGRSWGRHRMGRGGGGRHPQ